MERKRRYKPSRHRTTGFKTYLFIFLLCGVAAVVLDFLFGVPDKAKEFAEKSLNTAVRNAVRTEVTAAAKNAQSGAGAAQMQAAAAAAGR
ncbi:MAG TPA: hypothetical protein EYQ18_26150 [Candidatus Handelsmanbacteria bacterium]|nr:hypothetical protein [Candidatus Handelsmanbacteria bacterium]